MDATEQAKRYMHGDLFKRISEKYREKFPEHFQESRENNYGAVRRKPVQRPPTEGFHDYGEEGVNQRQQVPERPPNEKQFLENMEDIMNNREFDNSPMVQRLRYAKEMADKYGTFHSNEDLYDKNKAATIKALQEADKHEFADFETRERFKDAMIREALKEELTPTEYFHDEPRKPEVYQMKSSIIKD